MSEKNLTDSTPSTSTPARGPATPRASSCCPRRALLLFFAVCLWLAASPARTPSQSKPDIAGDIEGDKKAGKRNAAKPTTGVRPPAVRRRNAPAPAPRPPAHLEVTFVTGMADADVYLHRGEMRMQKLGRTDSDGRLVTRLPRGTHTVTASRPGSRIHRQQVDVRAGNTTFVFSQAGPTATPVGSSAAATSAGDVFTRYLDPRHTDGVSAGEWQLAASQTEAAFASNPLDPQAEAQALFTRAQLALLRGDYTSAIVGFNASALKVPTSALAYYGLGNAYLASNQLGEASRAYQRAAELKPELALPYKGMGDVLSRQGKNKEALRYYERARSLGYTSPTTSLVAARMLLKERRWQQALRELHELSKSSPSAEVFVGIGDAYVGLGQPLSAAPAYRRAAELDPKSALAHYKYGELAFAQREYGAAVDSFERALALDPAGALINRGRARELANKAADKVRQMK